MGSVEQLLAGIFKSKVLASQGQGGGGGAVQVGEAGGLPAAPWWPASAPSPPSSLPPCFPISGGNRPSKDGSLQFPDVREQE